MRSAIILAGGNSHRLGVEKALLEFDGRPLICWVAETLLSAADELLVVARDQEHAKRLAEIVSDRTLLDQTRSDRIRIRFTWDRVSGFGPVAGLEAGLGMAEGRFAFAAACDLPFLNGMVIQRLFELADPGRGYEAAVPVQPNGYFEPLHSVYEREKMQASCQRALEKGERRIHVPLQELVVNRVSKEHLLPMDPELLSFFNLNTSEDLEKARALWQEKGKKAD